MKEKNVKYQVAVLAHRIPLDPYAHVQLQPVHEQYVGYSVLRREWPQLKMNSGPVRPHSAQNWHAEGKVKSKVHGKPFSIQTVDTCQMLRSHRTDILPCTFKFFISLSFYCFLCHWFSIWRD